MALSPEYGWPEPDNSSLVKNGAQDIRALGDAIDTSVWNIGYGQAGKNKIINGDFSIWQRGTSFTFSGTGGYTADRFQLTSGVGGAVTVTREAFTAGTAPVAGYESQYFLNANYTTSGTGAADNGQYIEDVRTFAGETVTVSVWMKVSTGTHIVTPQLVQRFGSGGSSAGATSGASFTVTTSWQRFSSTITVPSIAGKTIGTGSSLQLRFDLGTTGVKQFSYWGYQVEYGSKATPFQTATGTLQGELAACQRYFYQFATGATKAIGIGAYNTTTEAYTAVDFPVTMRTTPTLSATTGTNYYRFQRSGSSDDFNSLTMEAAHTNGTWLYNNTEMSGTAGVAGVMKTQDAASSLAFSAEL